MLIDILSLKFCEKEVEFEGLYGCRGRVGIEKNL